MTLLTDIASFKQNALQWAASFDVCCYLDSSNFNDKYSKFDTLIAAGVKHEITATIGNAFEKLEKFRSEHPSKWVTGFFTYDLKNELEELSSGNIDGLQFPDLYFFVPKHLVVIRGNSVTIESEDEEDVFAKINAQSISATSGLPKVNLQSRFTKADYVKIVNKIKDHINRGDIYVTNFCQEFYANSAQIDLLDIFRQLSEISPNPFSAFFKHHHQYISCASPERFLAKRGSKLISQPIKGTASRSSGEEDEESKQNLRSHPKELQENVMIVDLVRNDLTRSAKRGTVQTEELFGIYSFKQVHQMISTVICELADDISDVEAIKNTFPMGSMTGAPKVSAMKLMEQYERSKRGLYSGSIGYFAPDGDFDFNVVIRTILYNAASNYLSFQVGSAITYHANAEQEYQECLLKAKAILEVLGQTGFFQQSEQ